MSAKDKDKDKNELRVFTDGACKGNPGPGGWGVFIRKDDKDIELFGGEVGTTNNRMELTAIIKALSIIDKGTKVILYTDSKYALDGISSWIETWKKNGWKTASKKTVKNIDLWKKMDQLVAMFEIDWVWVKGHSGDPGNERADFLANKGVVDL